MTMGEMWWKRMVNSVRFLEDAQDFIDSGKSVILNFKDSVPFIDEMTEEFERRVAQNDKNFEVHEVNKPIYIEEEKTEQVVTPGKYIFQKFCSKTGRGKYWAVRDGSHERYVASYKDTPLHTLVVCATGIDSQSASAWVKMVNEYTENCTMEDHGIFILVARNANVKSSDYVKCLNFSDYITDYDCMMLCLTMISSLQCSRIKKLYISEVASNIADNNIENAALLAIEEENLIQNPIETTRRVFEENEIKCTNLEAKVNSGVWEAQIRLVFPRIEDFRREIVNKYENKLQKYLPITNSIGERIDVAYDIEIAQLHTLCTSKGITSSKENKLLEKMHKARNQLAHQNPVSLKLIVDLGIF